MTWWILIVSFAGAASNGFEYAISNIPTYQECSRIAALIPENKYGGTKSFKCIEVRK